MVVGKSVPIPVLVCIVEFESGMISVHCAAVIVKEIPMRFVQVIVAMRFSELEHVLINDDPVLTSYGARVPRG